MTDAYNLRRAAQVAAYFANREGGAINVLKLAKLLYLAEREHLDRYDEPMFYDRWVSMEHGPVTSITLNLINGLTESDDWSQFITDRANHEVAATQPQLALERYDQLSKADIAILDSLWAQFGHMDRFELRDYTHENCPEWEDPDRSSKPIPYERVLKFLRKADTAALASEIEGWQHTSRVLAECR
ncbi:MAG TPA: hypothetical protein DF715_01480 [Oceanicaulis sp.]|nr:hypothetical protein [Oceanicaulis sp.]